MILWIRVVILSPQVFFRSYLVPFSATHIQTWIRMHIMRLQSINVIFLGANLALIMLLLVQKPISLENTIFVHVTQCWWSHSSCKTYRMHSIMFETVRQLNFYTWYSLMVRNLVLHTFQGHFLLDSTILTEQIRLQCPKAAPFNTLVSRNELIHSSKGSSSVNCLQKCQVTLRQILEICFFYDIVFGKTDKYVPSYGFQNYYVV